MTITLKDKNLEDNLMELSRELHIKTEDLIKQFLKESIEHFRNKKELIIDSSHIELMDNREKEEIVNIIKNQSAKDKMIDERYTQVFEI